MLTDKDDIPLVSELSVGIPTGANTVITLQKTKVL